MRLWRSKSVHPTPHISTHIDHQITMVNATPGVFVCDHAGLVSNEFSHSLRASSREIESLKGNDRVTASKEYAPHHQSYSPDE